MTGKRLLCAAALLAAVCGVFAQEASEDPTISKAKARLLQQLKDPESARWFGLHVASPKKPGGPPLLCGWVNSKNSFGGYVGFKPFLATADLVLVWGGEHDDFFHYAWESCGNTLSEKFGDALVALDFDTESVCKKSAERGTSPDGYDGCTRRETDAKTWLAAHPTAESIVTRCEREGREMRSYSAAKLCVDHQEWNRVLTRGPGSQ